jgi:LysM repeat protein
MLTSMMKLSPSKLILLLAPVLLSNCASTRSGGSGSATPSHNMSRSEYPFDENGVYHEEWAKGGADTGNVVDLTKNNPPSVFTGTSDARDQDTPRATKPKEASSGGGSSKPTPKPVATAKPTPKPTPKPAPKPTPKPVAAKPKPKPPAPKPMTNVTIQNGDTLYSLSKKHGVSVEAIQSANGMGSSTNLKDGSSVKIPK